MRVTKSDVGLAIVAVVLALIVGGAFTYMLDLLDAVETF